MLSLSLSLTHIHAHTKMKRRRTGKVTGARLHMQQYSPWKQQRCRPTQVTSISYPLSLTHTQGKLSEKSFSCDQMLFHSTTAPCSSLFIDVFKSPGTLITHRFDLKVDVAVLLSSFSSVLVPYQAMPQSKNPFFLCCYGNCVGISIKRDNRSKNKNVKERGVCVRDTGVCVWRGGRECRVGERN